MQQRLSVITLGVENLQSVKAFYQQKFGWQPVAENKDIVFFKMNGFLFSLFGKTGLAAGAGVQPGGSGFKSLTLAYNVASKQEVDELFKTLQAQGVTILKAPEPTPFGGYFFSMADPEDNVIEIAYNPYTPLDDEGNIITHKNIDDL